MSLMLLLSLLPATAGAPPVVQAPDTLVVCPAPLRPALTPWIKYRESQGHRLQVSERCGSPEEIRRQVRDAARGGRLGWVVLVGDADPAAARDAAIQARSLPTHHADSKVNYRWGSEPKIGTDNWYADLDDDQIPDVAVGRLTADSPEELARIVAKTIAYEQDPDMGPWRRQVNFVAGVGGFGAIADMLLEMTTKKFITDGIPAYCNTSMTYGSWQSPYCPDPRRFHQATLDRLNEGCLFWVYVGHGQRRYLDRVRVPGETYHILDVRDVPQMDAASGSPIAVFLSCYAGAFDEPQDCLAEEMLRTPGAPVAAICGSRVTMPYAMAVLSGGMLDEFFRQRRGTLGEVLLGAKQQAVAKESQVPNRQLLDTMAAAISPEPDKLADERAEHLLLFNLLGDPLLRLTHPQPVTLEVEEYATAGQTLEIAGAGQVPGRCTIELICRRDRLRFDPPSRGRFDATEQMLAAYQPVYDAANDQRWTTTQLDLPAGPFRTRIHVPEAARGACHVRVYVEGNRQCAAGAADVYVRAAETAKSP